MVHVSAVRQLCLQHTVHVCYVMITDFSTDLREVTPLAQAQKFAYHLKNDRWNFSVCGEDVVVLYSMDDKVVSEVQLCLIYEILWRPTIFQFFAVFGR